MASPVTAPFVAGSFPVGAVLAHQGGWDEILLVATPLVVIGLLLRIANKRVKAQLEEQEAAAAAETDRDPAAGERPPPR